MYQCASCGWFRLEQPPRTDVGGGSYEICPSCGFQPGVTDDDQGISLLAHRMTWTKGGMRWSSVGRAAPRGWNPLRQLNSLPPT